MVAAYNDIMRYRVYVGDENPATASVITTDDVMLFNHGQNDLVSNLSTGAAVTLRECDTSLFNSNGIIPNAQNFTVMGIGIDVHIANVQAHVPYADNTVSTIDAVPETKVNPWPLLDTIRSQGVFELWRNSTELLEQGNVADYPCGLYAGGWGSNGNADVPAVTQGTAAGLQAAYTVNGFVVAQNGMAFRPLTVWQELQELDQFHGKFKMCRPVSLTGTGLVFYIDFLLIGQIDLNRQSNRSIQSFAR